MSAQQEVSLSLLTPTVPQWQAAESLYLSAFPANERRSVEKWRQLSTADARFSVFAICRGGEFCGFISVWNFATFRYVEHFAVEARLRGKSIGSKVLRCLKTAAPSVPIVLEVEPPCDDMTRRRVRFYEGNGFVLSDLPYLQPPYEGTEWFSLCLMSTDDNFLHCHYEEIRGSIYSAVYGASNPPPATS